MKAQQKKLSQLISICRTEKNTLKLKSLKTLTFFCRSKLPQMHYLERLDLKVYLHKGD